MISLISFLEEWSFFGGSILLILIGLYGVITKRNLIKILIGLSLMDTGVNVLLVSLGYVENGNAPILTSIIKNNSGAFVDPIPQALVLTAIVIGVAILALGLAVTIKIYEKYGTLDISKIRGLKW
ncbi:MAG TPA: NADH-quinone oxidoreductase subunit K [Halanaerobiales bacterium]|nr:NADH-quinone oxidoreductase subunit K [Halanaerobiales bacterium]